MPDQAVPATAVSHPDALPQHLFDELSNQLRGPIYRSGHEIFKERSKMFNGNVVTVAKALVRPLDALDVSKIVIFCNKHKLSPSAKSGGYGTAGWAIGGDIILDMSLIRDIDIEAPESTRPNGYTGLRDMSTKGKGKARIGPSSAVPPNTSFPNPVSTSQKRRRDHTEEDIEEKAAYDARLRLYDTASPAVSSFFSGPPLPPTPNAVIRDLPKIITRDSTSSGFQPMDTDLLARSHSGSGVGSESESPSVRDSSHSTVATTPDQSPALDTTEQPKKKSPSADPFGYLNSPPRGNIPGGPSHAQSALHPSYQPWTASMQPSMSMSFSASTNLFAAFDIFNATPPADRFEPLHPHAFVTFGAGMKQKEIDIYTASNPLDAKPVNRIDGSPLTATIPYYIPTAAHPNGSTIMLLGGFGFLSRLYGLSVDNLVEVEMVLADGKIVIINEYEHPDLWWAIRGAGSAFGIATRYKAKAFPVPVVFAGNLVYRFHRATAASLIRHFRDCVKGAPRELYANVLLTAGPADQDSLIVIQMCYVGTKEKGLEYLQAISSWDGERCLLNEVNEKSFLNQQDSVAQILRGKAGRQWYIRSALITSLPDESINQTVMQFADTPIGCTWLFELAGGAIGDFENTCLPSEQRSAAFTIAALHQWELGTDDPRCISSAEEWLHETMLPVETGGPFPSFLGRNERAARTQACYGKNWSRLVEIKKKYDPDNVFRNTFWTLDKEGEVVEAETHEPPSP